MAADIAEATLGRDARRLRVALANSPTTVWEQDLDLRHTWIFNPKLGYAAEEVIGRTDFELFDEPSSARLAAIKRGVIATGRHARERVEAALPGGPEACYDLYVEPSFDEAGRIVGVICSATDITAWMAAEARRKAAEERQAFLFRLSDALRALDDPIAIQEAAQRALGERLGASRVAYDEDAGDGVRLEPTRDGTNGVPSLAGQRRFAGFGQDFGQAQHGGGARVRPDIAAEPLMSASQKAAHAALGLAAASNMPLARQGRCVALFAVHYAQPHAFTSDEIATIEATAERTWDAVERAKADAARRQSEARLARDLEISKRLRDVSALLTEGDVGNTLYENILDAAVAIMRSDFASLQVIDAEREMLDLVAWRNLRPESVSFWRRAPVGGGPTFGSQLSQGERIILPDLFSDAPDLGDSLEHARLCGIVAVQMTPLTTREGALVGVIATHWRTRHIPDEQDLRSLDILARQAADLFERTRALSALRASEALFTQFAQASDAGLWIRDAASLDLEFASPALFKIYGVAGKAEILGIEARTALVAPEDRDDAVAKLARAAQGESSSHEFRIRRPSDGALRWLKATVFPLRDENGLVHRIGGITEDITEAKLAYERQATLLAELQHRVRNIMAMIRSVVTRTGERAGSVAEYSSLLTGRLLALARLQARLTRAPGADAEIGAIVRDELGALAHHEAQFDIEGPELALPPKAAEAFALAVHELATNAVKYGALASREGRVSLRWTTFAQDGAAWLRFDWTEAGAPARPGAAGAARRRGFGSELIELRIPYELGGRGQIDIASGGAVCRLEFPLKRGASILETVPPSQAGL